MNLAIFCMEKMEKVYYNMLNLINLNYSCHMMGRIVNRMSICNSWINFEFTVISRDRELLGKEELLCMERKETTFYGGLNLNSIGGAHDNTRNIDTGYPCDIMG